MHINIYIVDSVERLSSLSLVTARKPTPEENGLYFVNGISKHIILKQYFDFDFTEVCY